MSVVTVTKQTDKPINPSVSISGNAITCSWGCKTNFDDGQRFQARMRRVYSDGSTKWLDWFAVDKSTNTYETNTDSENEPISKKARSRVIYFDLNTGYNAFAFRVKGQATDTYTKIKKPSGNPHDQHYYVKNDSGKYVISGHTTVHKDTTYYKRTNYTMSSWTEYAIDILPPRLTGINSTLSNHTTTVFDWDIANTDHREAFTKWQYQTCWVYNSDGSFPASAYDWETVTGGTLVRPGSKTVNDASHISGSSYSVTRWIRVRPLGPNNIVYGHDRAWVVNYHTYADPAKATVTSAVYNNRSVNVQWVTNSTFQHPVDKTVLQYRISIPQASITTVSKWVSMSLSCPATDEWKDYETCYNSFNNINIPISDDLTDKAIYVRIKNIHDYDTNVTFSDPVLVTNGVGALAKPTGLNCQASQSSSSIYTVSITRNTQLVGAFTAIWYRTNENQTTPVIVGIIPYNDLDQSIDVQIEYSPGDSPGFGVQAVVGNYSPAQAQETGMTRYSKSSVTGYSQMESAINWEGGLIPVPPIAEAKALDHSTIEVSWVSQWRDAMYAELSWSTHLDAWSSTDEPQTYLVKNPFAKNWNISNLAIASYYVRVRMVRKSGDSESYSTYSDPIGPISLASAPITPTLIVSPTVVPYNGSISCSWAYVSEDGSTQAEATIYEAYLPITTPDSNPHNSRYYEYDSETDLYFLTDDTSPVSGKTYYSECGRTLHKTSTAASVSLNISDLQWNTGEKHYLRVGHKSTYGMMSEVSDAVAVRVADPIGEVVVTSSLIDATKVIDYMYPVVENPSGNPHENEYYEYDLESEEFYISEDTEVDPEKTYYERQAITATNKTLIEFPLIVSATGAGTGGSTVYYIERAIDFTPYTPDESDRNGHEGETIAIATGAGETEVRITIDSLIGSLNDGARYRLYAVASDRYGQTAQSEYINFIVDWDHKAYEPEAEIIVDENNLITRITPNCTENGMLAGDVCDIYRLSVEKPELIIKDGVFGEEYVDPYPTLGRFGGHRIVYRTLNGDVITDNKSVGQKDYTAIDDDNEQSLFAIVIDFDGKQLRLPYNVSISNTWKKSFTETQYLGGSVVGDWNSAVSKNVSLNTVIPVEVEPDKLELLNRLATYSGICHVRTPDGASFSANVDVKDDREEKKINMLSKVTLTITRVKSEAFDGLTYKEWLIMQKVNPE